MISQQGYQNRLVKVDSGSLKSRPNDQVPFPSFLSERAAVILSVRKGAEEIIMKIHVADNPFIVLKLQWK